MKQAVTVIIRNKEKKFFLQKRDDKPDIAYPGAWCFPGGQIEDGEKSVEAMVREIEEELAVNVKPDELVFLLEHQYDDVQDQVFVYTGDQVPDSIREGAGFAYFSFVELQQMKLGFHEHELLPKIEQFFFHNS